MTRSADRRVWIDVAALLALSAGIRAAYAWAVPRMLDSADAIHYLETARAFARGNFFGIDPKIPILYPLLTAGASFIFGDLEVSGQAVSLLFSAMLVVPVFFSRELHGVHVARIAGTLIALWPWLVDERYGAELALRPLLDPAKAPESLRLVNATLSPYARARVVIYEFAPENGGRN